MLALSLTFCWLVIKALVTGLAILMSNLAMVVSKLVLSILQLSCHTSHSVHDQMYDTQAPPQLVGTQGLERRLSLISSY